MYQALSIEEIVNKQSIAVNGDESVRRSPLLKTDETISYLEEKTRTLHDVFLRGLKISNGSPCLGWRPGPDEPYKWMTYQEVLDRSQRFGSGLIAEGAKAEPTQFIGIFSQNRVEWKIAEQACNSYSMVIVPLYDTLGLDSIRHIINKCNLKIIVADSNNKAIVLLTGCKKGTFSIDLIILMEEPNEKVLGLTSETGIKVVTFSSVENSGKQSLKDFVPPSPNDLHTICFTSGTTGLPKGAMLTHGNLLANHAGIIAAGRDSFLSVSKDDVYISYLPLAHVFERLMAVAMFFEGARVGFFQGDIKLLLSDVAELKPTIFPMVPRLINRVYDKIWAGASQSVIKNYLLKKAVKAKTAKLLNGIVTKGSIWDMFVFRKIQALLGGRLRICIAGAAPVSIEVLNFMRVALGIEFPEGYGQTEATAGISISIPGDFASGSVGSPALCNIVKLVDVPDKNYFAKDGKGEICAKGSNIFKGYYKDPEKTKEAIDEDGWLHTGDVGMWLPNGALKIIDRKKHLFKLAQGEYIAPEKIEGILVQSPAVAQIFLYGESLRASLVAIVVPDAESFPSWCSGKGVTGEHAELCSKPTVNQLVIDDINAVAKQGGLKSFEVPKRIFLSTEAFSPENELLTPTFKSRRPQIYQRYEAELKELYKGLE